MNNGLFLGDDFFAWIMLAFGGALLVGNVMALVRRPANLDAKDLEKPPARRVIPMLLIGLVISIWALASLTFK